MHLSHTPKECVYSLGGRRLRGRRNLAGAVNDALELFFHVLKVTGLQEGALHEFADFCMDVL